MSAVTQWPLWVLCLAAFSSVDLISIGLTKSDKSSHTGGIKSVDWPSISHIPSPKRTWNCTNSELARGLCEYLQQLQADGPGSRYYSGVTSKNMKFTSRGLYLRISPDGKVNGTPSKNDEYTELVRTGVEGRSYQVTLKGLKSNRYLAMDKKGRLKGLKVSDPYCHFYEKMEQNYTIFRSVYRDDDNSDKPWLVALAKDGRPINGRKQRKIYKKQKDKVKAKWRHIFYFLPIYIDN